MSAGLPSPATGEGVPVAGMASSERAVIPLRDISLEAVRALLARFGLQLECVPDGAPIPGSYWGEPEAGIIGARVYVRGDTPVHSLLHEACHLIVLPEEKAAMLQIARRMITELNADALVLGCTELPLIIKPEDLPVPVLDTTEIHIEAILNYMLDQETCER